MKKILLIPLMLTFSIQLSVAQNLKRANLLFERRAYLNAAELFLNEEPKTQEVLEKLADCYYFNTKMSEAETWYKILLQKYDANVNPTYLFRYSQALKGVKKFGEADKWFQKYLEKKQMATAEKQETLSFFEALNSGNKKPYSVHKVSINSTFSDFGTAYFGDKVVFASTRNSGKLYDWNNQPYLDLFQADVDENQDLKNVVPFAGSINTDMHESNAIFTKDGKTMYFTRNNSVSGKKNRDKNKVTHLKIYKAQFVNNEWTNIAELPFNSNDYSVEHPALSPDEKQLYFASDMPGTIGSFDLFVVDINTDGTYGTPKNLGPKINTEMREQFPFVSSKNILYFASDGHFGLGGLDIFRSEITDESFSKPTNLSDIINSNLDDFAFVIDEKNEIGYFSSNRDGGAGDDDIYRFTQKKIYEVHGLVQNKRTLELLPGTLVSIFDINDTLLSKMNVGEDAYYLFEVENNKTYKLVGTRNLYVPSEVEFSTNSNGDIDKNIQMLMEMYTDVEKEIVVENDKTQIKINPIYFDFNKWNIRKDSALELNNVVNIMKKYPDMSIEIGAHTDARGSYKYNLELSKKRAISVMDYLISQGISENRLKSEGFGESQPLNHCTEPNMCTEKEYSINRRCEFVITE
jgi:outer membrane protein OmpA-like peptidoglycan-associated protein/tetratricopeptide (TPR) repeat protein